MENKMIAKPKGSGSIGVATRGSKLALAQTAIVLRLLRRSGFRGDFEVVEVKTTGDLDRRRPLFRMDQKGIFEKQVNEAVLEGRADFAVHSLKDVPSDLSSELVIGCVPKRARPNDVLVGMGGRKLEQLRPRARVGTSSLRRAVQLLRFRQDLAVSPVRGNIESRVRKAESGEFDAIMLAYAGLSRLQMRHVISETFSLRDFVPAPGQGAIAIVCRKKDQKIRRMLQQIEDSKSRAEVVAERSVVELLEGGCRFPLGAVATSKPGRMTLHTSIFSADGSQNITLRESGEARYAEQLGKSVAKKLVAAGALELAQGWRRAVEEWNGKGGTEV
ncbi:MAG: hydroxymethylbilane synthase [Nitrososphaera sp.]